METQTKYLLSQASTGTIPYISRKKFEEMVVPVPPKEVQREIVHILDEFTLLTSELSAELTSELSARRKQYEFYRDKLLSFEEMGGQYSFLGDIMNIHTGSKPDAIYEDYNNYEYINAGTTNSGYTESYNCDGDTVTTPSRGQGGIGSVGYQKKPFHLGPLCYAIKSKDDSVVSNKYIYYWLCSHNQDILSFKKEGGTPAVNRSDLMTINVFVPSIERQKRITDTLDNFESICNDLNIGLPAEIDARQKQYEYYRDLLLTFHEKGDSKC